MDKVGSLDVSWIQGASSLNFVDDKTVCYMCGSHICFLDLETKKQRMFHCDVKGIGVLTANGHSGVFVFSEHKLNPSIFVYSFPKIELKNELKGSAQLDYTSLALCDGGPYLSCHSTFPDYTITVWNWQKGEKLCCHENERDVISLEFNPLNWSQFCALGTEHVTVWSIEKSEDFHVLKPRMIELPAIEISLAEIADHLGLEASSSVVEAELIVTELTPTAICWTATSELYVGCAQGFLLLADPQSHSVTVLYNPRSPDAIPELRQSKFLGITLEKDGLIAVGKEDVLHRLKIKGTQIDITQTWILESAICGVKHSLDYETFLMSTDTGHIFLLKPHQSDEIVRFPWVSSSNFVAAAMLRTDKNICLSLKQCGKLQLWSPHGDLLGIMYLKTETKCLACCPVAQCAAIGTASGSVHIIDLNTVDHPRVVHKVHLYHTPVDYLVFDQGGNFILCTSDRHVHVLHAKPSKGFSVIGYTVVPGSILSLSTQYIREPEQVRVLALCWGESGRMTDGSLLTVFALPVEKLAEPACVDRNGRLCSEILRVRLYEVPHPIQACVLGINRFFAYCHKKKLIQRFPLPQNIEGVSSQQVVQLTPDQEASGHPLGPASLVLSPHNIWLASVGRDGLLRVRETSAMEQHIEVQCHSYRGGGVKDVSFSADSQTLLTTGYSDGSVVCLFIKITGDDSRIKEATQYSLAMGSSLKSIFDAENLVLTTLPDWGQESYVETKEIEVQPQAETHAVTHEDEAPPCTPPSERIWMESRQEAVIKEDNEYYSETKESLKKTVQMLRDTLQAMMTENQTLPAMEQLKHEEFDMGGEENKILEEIANKLREEIETKISKNCYLYDVVKRDIWDSMTVKYKTIMAFQLKQGVKNYPLREPPEEELKELRQIQNMRKLEMATSTPSAAVKQLQESLKKRAKTSSKEEEELREGGQEAPCASLTETYSDLLGYTNPYIYNQLELTTTEQRINQIYLLQDLIYNIRARFNTDFEVLHKQKIQVINGMRERNRQIREMMMELGINETLWEPSLECMEQPEILLNVDDSEIKAEKYLTQEEKKQEMARKKLENEKRLATEGDNLRVRALDNMMGGALEGKKEDVLKMEIPPPEFVSTKPENEWDEDEKKAYEDYEKKTIELDERKEAYKKSLEAELKKLQAANKDSIERFDQNLRKLAQKKLKCQMAIFQERLKIVYLINSVMQENKMRHRHEELRLQREKMTAHMNECLEEVTKHEEEVRVFHETYDAVVAEDKVVEQDFNAEFSELPCMMVTRIHKLFKRRPRTQRAGTHAGSNPFKERTLCVPLAPDALGKTLEAMDELDHAEHMPEGMNPLLWEQFCHIRRTKVETEHKVKVASLTLAEKQAFLARRRAEYEEAKEEAKNLYDALESLHDEKFNFLMNLMLHVLLKTNQVEVPMMGLQAAYTDAILLHPSVLQELNAAMRMLGEQRISAMMEYKEVHEIIFRRQCEHKMMDMQIEDQKNLARNVWKLKLFEEEKDYLNERDRESCLSKQVSSLEKTVAFQEKNHRHNLVELTKMRERLIAKAAQKRRENELIEQELSGLAVTVAERAHIHEAIGKNQSAEKDDSYWEVTENLKSIVKAQEEELAFLAAELKRLMNKNFPKFPELNPE